MKNIGTNLLWSDNALLARLFLTFWRVDSANSTASLHNTGDWTLSNIAVKTSSLYKKKNTDDKTQHQDIMQDQNVETIEHTLVKLTTTQSGCLNYTQTYQRQISRQKHRLIAYGETERSSVVMHLQCTRRPIYYYYYYNYHHFPHQHFHSTPITAATTTTAAYGEPF